MTASKEIYRTKGKERMKNICIIGSGSWGCALAIHAAKMGHQVKLWSFAQNEADLINNEKKCKFLPMATMPDNIYCTTDIKEEIGRAHV